MTPLAFDGSVLTLAKGEGIRWKLFRQSFPPEGRKLQIVVKLTCFEVQDNVVVKSLSHVQLFYDPMDCSLPGFFVHGDSPGKNTGVGCHALLQGNLPMKNHQNSVKICFYSPKKHFTQDNASLHMTLYESQSMSKRMSNIALVAL